MTCIVALETDKGVLMGADSCVSTANEAYVVHRSQSKIFKLCGYLFGFAGVTSVGTLIRHGLAVEPPPRNVNGVERHMMATLIPAIKLLVKDNLPEVAKGKTEDSYWSAFIATRGAIYELAMGEFLLRHARGYAAIGNGGEIALGALHATKQLNIVPRERARAALKAAVEHVEYVRPPFTFIEHGRDD